MDRYFVAAKIRRPHGFDGALLCDYYVKNPKDLLNLTLFLDFQTELKPAKIIEVFGANHHSCRIRLDGYPDLASIQELRNVLLKSSIKNEDADVYFDEFIGLEIMDGNEYLGVITGVYDFGAGIVVDTNFSKMFSLDQLNYENIQDGKISLINLV